MDLWRGRRGLVGGTFIALVALGAPGAGALDFNGFLRPAGKGDVAVSATQESYDEFWAGEMKTTDPGLGEVTTQSLSVWVAYGISDDLTLIATLPWVDSEGDGSADLAESDLQDASVLAAYRFGSLGTSVRSEFIGAAGLRTPASDYEANLPVDVGDGTTDGLLRLIYQLRYAGFYFSQQVGYDVRGGEAPDGMPLYTEAGFTAGRTTINAFYSKLVADAGTDIGDPGFTFPSNEEEYERVGAKVYVRLGERFGVAVGAFDTLDGRNTGDSKGASLGVNIGF